jgi:type IV secretory pathway VirJ component
MTPAGAGALQAGAAGGSGAARGAGAVAGADAADGPGSVDGAGTAGGARAGRGAAPVDVFNYDRFGAVNVYRSRGRARDVVLFISGDAGWDGAAAALAQRLADKGAIVAGIDLRRYREALQKASEACVSPSPDLENLSHYLQSKLGLKKYIEPTLVGYGAGATLAYETLAESPEGLFKSVLTIGFCPDLALSKPLCKSPNIDTTPRLNSSGLQQAVALSAASHLAGRWVSLQGELDKTCPAPLIKKFMASVPGSDMVALPRVAHDYAVPGNWMSQYDAAYARVAALPRGEIKSSGLPAAVADLPLVIVPAVRPVASAMPVAAVPVAAGAGGHGDWFGVFLTGDGGWVGLDKGVSAELAKHDIPIVGWDSLKYFWSRRTPEGASRDLDRVVRTYARLWGRSRVLLIGYSQGADTLPFMVNRLPDDTHRMVGYTTLLGISDNALWEFKVATWLGSPPKGIPTGPELARWSGAPYLCMYGESDGDAACAQLTGHDGTVLKLAGGHHFDGGYSEIADDILKRLPQI